MLFDTDQTKADISVVYAKNHILGISVFPSLSHGYRTQKKIRVQLQK